MYPRTMLRLQGKVAIVTGAARGIGRVTAERFVEEGARVLLVDIDERGRELAEAGDRRRRAVAFRRLDVAQQGDAERMVEECVRQFGRLDVLVNNAWSGSSGSLRDINEATWRQGLDVCLSATLWSAKAAAPHLREVGGGSIVSIASVHGIHAARGWIPYDPVKGGLIALVRSLAVELGPDNIRVNAVSPGFVLTERNSEGLTPERRQRIAANYCLPRLCTK